MADNTDLYRKRAAERWVEGEPIAVVTDPARGMGGGGLATKIDPVTGNKVVDREAEEAAIDQTVANAQEYINQTSEATPKVDAEGGGEVPLYFLSKEEGDRLHDAAEVERAVAAGEPVDPIEGLIAAEEDSRQGFLTHSREAKDMADQQAKRGPFVDKVLQAWSRGVDRQEFPQEPYGPLRALDARRMAALAVDAILEAQAK